MAATMNVLLPTGRRQNVKVTANTRILQVIENACSKIGCNPSEYNLKHHRSILDPQLSIRYANLPNNCKLELVKADRPRMESAVHIALQVESGERLQQHFAPSTSLWDILVHWESQRESPHAGKLTASTQMDDAEKTVHPVCIYLSQEVVGEAWLRATALKSLGLTSGKAVIRLLHRVVDLPAPPSAPSSKPTTTSPTAQIQSSSRPSVSTSRGRSTSAERCGDGGEPVEAQKPDAESHRGKTNQQERGVAEARTVVATKTPPKQEESKRGPDVTSGDLKSTNSGHSEPMEVEDSANTRQSVPGSASESLDGSAGARPKRTQPKHRDVVQQQVVDAPLSQEMEQQANLMGASLADAILKHRGDQQLAQLKKSWSTQTQSQPTFGDFKFPEQPSVHTQSLSVQQRSRQLPEPCDRQPLIFSLDRDTGDPSAVVPDIPDNFFDVTVDDIRRMMADQQIHMTSKDGQLLQTKAMREANALKKAEQYTKVAIRVHFPDRYILQGFFRPLEPLGALRDFIRAHLLDPEIKFYLYTTPPRCVLNDDTQSLFKAKLFPAAVVHFGSETARDHYLRSDLMSEVASFARAKVEAASGVHPSPSLGEAQSSSGSIGSQKSDSGLSAGASTSTASAPSSEKQDPQGSGKRQASGEPALNSEKIPKWFKMGKR